MCAAPGTRVRIISRIEEFGNPGRCPVHCTIGMFDGLHRGHRRVIERTVAAARTDRGLSVAITFDRHPATVVAPERAPSLIYPLHRRRKLLEATSLDFLWIIPFDRDFSRIGGREFLEMIHLRLRPLQSICVGPDFHFGHRRSGSPRLLRECAPALGYRLPRIEPVRLDGREVSSTAIRSLIARGALTEAGALLGRDYTLCGTVVRGRQLGRRLGFPTANLDTRGLVLPPPGVYPVRAALGEERLDGVANIGTRPTVGSGEEEPTAEVHLLDFDEDIHGRTLELSLCERLRRERRFESLEALGKRIEQDIALAREHLVRRRFEPERFRHCQ